jgi:multiple sugar transport system permease protein
MSSGVAQDNSGMGRAAVRPPSPVARRRRRRREASGAAILVAPFVCLLLVAGIIPTGYAIYESFRAQTGSGLTGFTNFSTMIDDFRFASAFEHIGVLVAVWVPAMMVIVTLLALLVHASRGRFGTTMRFIYYLPGALAGIANFMLWLYILDPTLSPFKVVLRLLGFHTLGQVVLPQRVPIIIGLMLFFQGAGTWLVILYGGFNSISEEVLEAARIDGAGSWRVARDIKLPLIRPWLGYMLLLNIAYGFQLFLEPSLLGEATHGLVSPTYTPNELSYTYAFGILNPQAAAAMSVILLVISLGIGLLIVTRVGLFKEGA